MGQFMGHDPDHIRRAINAALLQSDGPFMPGLLSPRHVPAAKPAEGSSVWTVRGVRSLKNFSSTQSGSTPIYWQTRRTMRRAARGKPSQGSGKNSAVGRMMGARAGSAARTGRLASGAGLPATPWPQGCKDT
jgi:hypothetical protein